MREAVNEAAQAKLACEARAKEYNSAHNIEPVNYLLSEGFGFEQLEKLNKLLDVSYAELAARYDQASPSTKSQMLGQYSDDSYKEEIRQAASMDNLLSCIKRLDEFEEKEASWLVPGFIPEGQITLLAADGGVGKTTMWVNLAAAVSAGKRCVLDPEVYERDAGTVLFLTTEDSVEKKLKQKLRLAGAHMPNVYAMDFSADNSEELVKLKFGSEELKELIQAVKPVLCIFDPVQGFVPPEINMGSRNAMRNCMAPLVALGEETGCTFVVIAHSNKRKNASGRDRISDSSDLWDISRSVLMAGNTREAGVKYLSQEKNNYTQLQKTILFTIDDDGVIHKQGTTWKRDREFMAEYAESNAPSKIEECKQRIIEYLDNGNGKVWLGELDDSLKAEGFNTYTIRKAKEALKDEGLTSTGNEGYLDKKKWYLYKLEVSPSATQK